MCGGIFVAKKVDLINDTMELSVATKELIKTGLNPISAVAFVMAELTAQNIDEKTPLTPHEIGEVWLGLYNEFLAKLVKKP